MRVVWRQVTAKSTEAGGGRRIIGQRSASAGMLRVLRVSFQRDDESLRSIRNWDWTL
jgi:hypothetical protein